VDTSAILERKPVGRALAVGRVLASIQVENLEDLFAERNGLIGKDQVRRIEIADALADTGATMLALPTRFIEQLGLYKTGERRVITATGKAVVTIYDPVRVAILGRDCVVEVMEVPNDVPALVGHTPLEMLDLVVNPAARTLTANPAHGGEHVLELLKATN
jgi:predicted aspartyl protease